MFSGLALAVFAAGATTGAGAQTAAGDMSAPEIMAKTRDAYAALSSYSDDGRAIYEISGQKLALRFGLRLQHPNLYRLEWTQDSGLKGVVWCDGNAHQLQVEPGSSPMAVATAAAGGFKGDSNQRTMANMKLALSAASSLSYSVASAIPGAFFNQDCGDLFVWSAIAGRFPFKKEADAAVEGVVCYVVSADMDLSKTPDALKSGTVSTTLWIGKHDFLVHQSRARYVEKVDESPEATDQAIDEAIKKALQMQNQPATPEAVAAMRPQMRAVMKQVQSTIKSGFEVGLVFTQVHEHIAVNRTFVPSDFAP